jgi:hypothetical protein
MGTKVLLSRKDEKKDFTVDNLKRISYPLYSKEIDKIMGHLVVTDDGSVYLYRKGLKGSVTEWY